MTTPNAPTLNFELDRTNAEAFMPLDRMETLTWQTLLAAGRIDDQGIVQPIEVKRRIPKEGSIIGTPISPIERDDIFVPSADEQRYSTIGEDGVEVKNRIILDDFSSSLYDRLTVQHVLSQSEVDVANLRTNKENLEGAIAASGTHRAELDKIEHSEHAFYIDRITPGIPEFEALRIYIPGAQNAPQIVTALLKKGADFDFAKVWTPKEHVGHQRFRTDTPILEVVNFSQLHSVMTALRDLQAEGILPAGDTPMAGYPIHDLPGVYAGQTVNGNSFNQGMSDLFGNAIREACQGSEIHAGNPVEAETLTELAIRGREIAQATAAGYKINDRNHAFVEGQPVEEILAALQR